MGRQRRASGPVAPGRSSCVPSGGSAPGAAGRSCLGAARPFSRPHIPIGLGAGLRGRAAMRLAAAAVTQGCGRGRAPIPARVPGAALVGQERSPACSVSVFSGFLAPSFVSLNLPICPVFAASCLTRLINPALLPVTESAPLNLDGIRAAVVIQAVAWGARCPRVPGSCSVHCGRAVGGLVVLGEP